MFRWLRKEAPRVDNVSRNVSKLVVTQAYESLFGYNISVSISKAETGSQPILKKRKIGRTKDDILNKLYDVIEELKQEIFQP